MLAYLVIFILLVLIVAFFFSDKIIFQPPRTGQIPPADMKMLEVTKDVKIAILYMPTAGSRYTILYSHGNGDDLFDLRHALEDYNKHGYSIVAYDYEGYGASQGKATEDNCYRDIEAVYKYMIETLKIPSEQIIIYGRSVGSGPSCFLAENSKAAALILESPFKTAFKVVCPIPMPFDKFPNIDRIKNIKIPVMVFHGRKDGVIPFSHGKAVFQEAGEPKTFVEVQGAGHNNLIYTAGDKYWQALKTFIETKVNTDKVTEE